MIGQDTTWRPKYPEPPVPATSPVTVIREYLELVISRQHALQSVRERSLAEGEIIALRFALRALGVGHG